MRIELTLCIQLKPDRAPHFGYDKLPEESRNERKKDVTRNETSLREVRSKTASA
jgi:hypothetical protein